MSGVNNSPGPIPISRIAHQYYLYNIDHVTYLRREHNILGVLSGTLPQSPQQNVFLGLPLQLLAEEARMLVEQGYAYIIDDVQIHRKGFENLSGNERRSFKRSLADQGLYFTRAASQQAKTKRQNALEKLPEDKRNAVKATIEHKTELGSDPEPSNKYDSESLFSSNQLESTMPQGTAQPNLKPYQITPTTSFPPFRTPATNLGKDISLPQVPSISSYSLFKHLHSKSYFLSPGIRFGAQYSVYPGDPLRFHAHFLARGFDWDEEIDLLGLIGGGRLGTGVKKGYLIGGPFQGVEQTQEESAQEGTTDKVRCFCVEWAGM